jgi:hypothetical protein
MYTSVFTGLQVTVINELTLTASVLKNSLENANKNEFLGLIKVNLK